jgi:hypothetical protein
MTNQLLAAPSIRLDMFVVISLQMPGHIAAYGKPASTAEPLNFNINSQQLGDSADVKLAPNYWLLPAQGCCPV